jgi:hypothetical protein
MSEAEFRPLGQGGLAGIHERASAAGVRGADDPSIADVIRFDPTLPLDERARDLAASDLTRWSHRALLPFVRVLSLVSVFFIRALKALVPFQFRSHAAIDVLCVWFMRRFMSPEAGELLARHFILETNLLAFIARNSGEVIDPPALRPTSLAELGRGAVIEHDVNVYKLVVAAGKNGADLRRRDVLDFSMLHVPPIDSEPKRRRWLELDIETGLYLMNIPFCLFTTQREYERAVNSFQLDESLCAMLASLTGDDSFRTWTPHKFPMWISVRRDVPKELLWHAAVTEYAHGTLCRMRDAR